MCEHNKSYWNIASLYSSCPKGENGFTKLETIEPRSTEVIVLYFDSDCSLDELENIGKTIQKEFPNNKIICISDKVDLKLWDKDTLENYIGTLNEILEEL